MSEFASPEESKAWAEQIIAEPIEVELPEPEPEIEEPLGAGVLGLLYLGRLTKSFNYHGHDFVIKTLKMGEELEAALITQEFENSSEYPRALAAALVAASIETVDGKPIVSQLGPSEDDLLQRKYTFIKEKWYWPTVRYVYDQYVELLQEQKEALDEFEKK